VNSDREVPKSGFKNQGVFSRFGPIFETLNTSEEMRLLPVLIETFGEGLPGKVVAIPFFNFSVLLFFCSLSSLFLPNWTFLSFLSIFPVISMLPIQMPLEWIPFSIHSTLSPPGLR